MGKRILLAVLVFSASLAHAQGSYSLLSCVDRVLEHNVSMEKAKSGEESAALSLSQARNAYIPSLAISNQHNLSTGRVLDPTTYNFVTNKTVYDMSASIGGSLTLFSGFERSRLVQREQLSLQSARLQTEKTRNELILNVTALFLEIVLDKETIAMCENKIAYLQKQEELIARKVEYQTAVSGDLLNIQADINNARVDLAAARNNLNLDKIAMCELLALDDWMSFDISVDNDDFARVDPRLWSYADVEMAALSLPQIRQGEIAVKMANRDVEIASSSFWPSLKLNAGYGSTFSNARTRSMDEDYSFRDQMRDNQSSYVTLSLSIPILGAISVSNNVKAKELAASRATYDLMQAKETLRKEVRQAISNANAAYETYSLLEANVDKCVEALRQTEQKYDLGAATYYDYQAAVSNLYEARARRLQSKYEYIFRTKIIELYTGRTPY